MKINQLFVTSVLTASLAAAANADAPAPGCYKPVRGFATSICTDAVACSTQSGIYRLVLRNDDAPWGERRLVVSGTFNGFLENVDQETNVSTLRHVLMDASAGGQIFTGPDIGIPVGGDGVETIEVIETLTVNAGAGAYQGIVPGGTVTLEGQLGLQTGINSFTVKRTAEDVVCFE